MLEKALTELFEQQTSVAQPPVRASVARAAKDGRVSRRRRRAGTVGTPLFAAGAVAAIAVAAAILPGQAGPHGAGHRPGAAANPQLASSFPRHFNPQYAYAAFGWLPKGASFTVGLTEPGSINLEADSSFPPAKGSSVSGYSWRWSGYARGQCHLDGAVLGCGGQQVLRITSRAADIGGQPAYWGFGPQYPGGPINVPDRLAPRLLAYHFAGGWATLGAPRAGLVKVARAVRMVAPAKISYSVHLTGVPASWRIVSSSYFPNPTGPATNDFSVRASAASQVDVNSGPRGMLPCDGQPLVVGGVHVLVSQDSASPPYPVTYTLCASNDHHEWIRITEDGRASISVIPLFRSHLRLLGLHPASWTTRPLN